MKISYTMEECLQQPVKCTHSVRIEYNMDSAEDGDNSNVVILQADGSAVVNGDNRDSLMEVSQALLLSLIILW